MLCQLSYARISRESFDSLVLNFVSFCKLSNTFLSYVQSEVCPANWAIEEYVKHQRFLFGVLLTRQLSTFPGSYPPSIIDVKELNFCVRHGNRWFLLAIVTGFFSSEVVPSKLNNALTPSLWLLSLLSLRFACFDQALGLLVPVSYIHYCTSTSGLSTM